MAQIAAAAAETPAALPGHQNRALRNCCPDRRPLVEALGSLGGNASRDAIGKPAVGCPALAAAATPPLPLALCALAPHLHSSIGPCRAGTAAAGDAAGGCWSAQPAGQGPSCQDRRAGRRACTGDAQATHAVGAAAARRARLGGWAACDWRRGQPSGVAIQRRAAQPLWHAAHHYTGAAAPRAGEHSRHCCHPTLMPGTALRLTGWPSQNL